MKVINVIWPLLVAAASVVMVAHKEWNCAIYLMTMAIFSKLPERTQK